MKIIFSSNSSFYIYTFRLDTIKELVKLGYEIHIVASEDKYSKKLIAENLNFHSLYVQPTGMNVFADLYTLISLIKIYNKINPEIVFNSTIKLNTYGSIAAKINGAFCVNNITGLGSVFINNNFKSNFVTLLYKISNIFVDFFYFQNNDDLNFFIDNKITSHKKSITIPGSGVETKKYKSTHRRNGTDFNFIFASRIIKEKGILDFIYAAKLLNEEYPNITYNIFGSFDKTRNHALKSNDILNAIGDCSTIKLHGHTDDIIFELDKAHCLVLPTYYREGIPKILLEACSMNVPIIATNHVGVNEILIDNYNGFFCRKKDPIDLKEKMEKMFNLSDDKILMLGSNGRSLAEEKFDTKVLLAIYLETISLYQNSV